MRDHYIEYPVQQPENSQAEVKFNFIEPTYTLFRDLLQILGMHNFLIDTSDTSQDIWVNNELQATLVGPKGNITLKINRFKEVSLEGGKIHERIVKACQQLRDFNS